MTSTNIKRILPGRESLGGFPRKVKARKPEPGRMNKTEELYSLHLLDLRTRGEIVAYVFEPMKFRLADNTFYTPDFLVISADGTAELHEVKASWDGGKTAHFEDDARVKIKVAAVMFPWFTFVAVHPSKDAIGRRVWNREVL